MKTFKAIALAALAVTGGLGLVSATRAHAASISSTTDDADPTCGVAAKDGGVSTLAAGKDGGVFAAASGKDGGVFAAASGKDGGVFAAASGKDGGAIALADFEKGDAGK